MNYEILSIFWLLCMFFGCCGLYCFAIPCPILRKNLPMPHLEAVVSTERQPAIVCDFANREFSALWFSQFSNLPLDDRLYSGFERDNIRYLNNYLGIAFKYEFAIPIEECIAWWKDMIKACKPQSPTRLAYYEHIKIEKPALRYDKDFDVRITCKPDYNFYGCNGFGYHPNGNWKEGFITVGSLVKPMCDSWLKEHYKKYPNGKLPEQTIEKRKVTSSA